VKLTDGTSLVLKCPLNHNIRVLRHERTCLDTERKTLEIIHRYTQLPVPDIIQYDAQCGLFGSSFLIMSYVPGRTLSEIASWLTATERKSIDRALGAYVRTLTTLSSTQFGTIRCVSAKKGSTSWRKAFLGFLEAALRDAEDILVTIPYDSIRYYIERLSYALDEVTEPRLVALDACNPDNVLIDEHTKQITGLIGFSNVIWGDALMCGGLAGGSSAFYEGFGQCPVRHGGVKARILM
jgi:aminoglycoside phosphotransferase (APT) family kinase protein